MAKAKYEQVYVTVRSAKPDVEIERGMQYHSIVHGQAWLHYDAVSLLRSVAEVIRENPTKKVILRSKLPSADAALTGVLGTIVEGHNLVLECMLPQMQSAPRIRKVLEKRAVS